MTDNEAKAKALREEAEKRVKSADSFLGRLFGGAQKIEEAVELYHRSANMFKMAKKWNDAGNAFCVKAELQLKAGSNHQAASDYVDASNCYKKTDANEAVKVLLLAIEIYTDMGRFTIAAKHHFTIAEIYENEMVDLEKAITHFEQAADYYKGEESNSSANKCLLKVAQYSAHLEKYEKASAIYKQVAETAMVNSLLKYSAKDYFFKAALCQMCVDLLNAQHAVQEYKEMYPAFEDSREYKLLRKLIEAAEEQNVDDYTDAVKEYDSITRLDQWLTTILLRIKKAVGGDPDLR